MVKFVEDDVFDKKLKNLLSTSNDTAISSLVNDFDEHQHLVYDSKIKLKCTFSNQFLDKIGFHWPIINKDYISKLLRNI